MVRTYPHNTLKQSEYSIKCYKRYKYGKYSKFGKYIASLKYVHYNKVDAAINWLLKEGHDFNYIKVYHRHTQRQMIFLSVL